MKKRLLSPTILAAAVSASSTTPNYEQAQRPRRMHSTKSMLRSAGLSFADSHAPGRSPFPSISHQRSITGFVLTWGGAWCGKVRYLACLDDEQPFLGNIQNGRVRRVIFAGCRVLLACDSNTVALGNRIKPVPSHSNHAMPGIVKLVVSSTVHRSAKDLPAEVWHAWNEDQERANVMLPRALALRNGAVASEPELWVCVWTEDHAHRRRLLYIASCTQALLGGYPIFLFSTLSADDIQAPTMKQHIDVLVDALADAIPKERNFSVFGPAALAQVFADSWTEHTGIPLASKPEYYSASFSHCTVETLKRRQQTLDPHFVHESRLAQRGDVNAVSELCHAFAADSEPFTLTPEQALAEAKYYVDNGQVWVHCVSENGGPPKVASIAAVTRVSDDVAAITKVFTNDGYRGRKCAQRLVRYVCDHLLVEKGKRSVVLYVALDKVAARKVYSNVGFVGLDTSAVPTQEAAHWLELGFHPDHVELGHW